MQIFTVFKSLSYANIYCIAKFELCRYLLYLGVRTMFAGSSCNAIVTIGSLVISGHFDKKVRFWDKRTESQSNEITLQGRVTSLDLAGGKFIVHDALSAARCL